MSIIIPVIVKLQPAIFKMENHICNNSYKIDGIRKLKHFFPKAGVTHTAALSNFSQLGIQQTYAHEHVNVFSRQYV